MASNSDGKSAAERTILVSDVPTDLDEVEILEVYLESPKIGGGKVLSFRHDSDTRTAVITFDSKEVAGHFLSAGQICVMNRVMPVSSAASLCSLYVLGVPANLVEVLELFLGNSKKGGGDIELFEFNPNTRTACVVFAEASVAEQLSRQGYIDVNKHRLVVSKTRRCEDMSLDLSDHIDDDAQSTTDDEKLSRCIFIEDVPPDMVDFLELHLESKKFGGGIVEEFTPKHGGVLAVFEDAKVAEHLLDVGEVKFAGRSLHVVKPDQRCLLHEESSNNDPEDDDDDDSIVEISSTVLVRGIPSSMSKDILRLFLENSRRSGGGDIAEIVDFDAKLGTAVITFEDSQVAQSMLSKGSVRFNDTTVLEFIKPPDASTNSGSDKIKTADILISEISGISQEKLKMFLENPKRSGGGKVVELQYDGDGHAIVHFEDDKIAEEMIRKGQIQYMDGRTLAIAPASPTRCLQSRMTRLQLETQSRVPRCTAPRTIEVTGFKKATSVTLETLRLYFENKNRSGGGDVEDFQLTPSGNAIVTFRNSEDAVRVAKKPSGHSLSQVPLAVRLLQSWPARVSCAVKVTGFSAKTTKDELTMLFENKQRSGGGLVTEVHFDQKNGTAVITFDKRDDAVSVVQRQPPSLHGCTLSVEAVLPACPPPFMDDESNILRDSFIFAVFPVGVKSNAVREFARRAAEVAVKDVKFSCLTPGCAMITYATSPDYGRLMWSLCSWPCQGQMLSLERVSVPRSVQVFNIGSITKDNLELYFESGRANGGVIRRIEMPPKFGCAIVEFDSAQVVDRVLKKGQHSLSDRTLNVSVYYDELGVVPPDFDCSLPYTEIPEDVDANCKPEIVEFVRANKQLRSKIEEQLKKLNCILKWPRKFGDQLVLHCTVSPLQPAAYFLVRGWADKCSNIMHRELAGILLCSIPVLHEIWQPLRDAAAKGRTYAPEEMLIHWEDETSTVHFCGLQTHVDRFDKDINKIKDGMEEELRKRKAEVTDESKIKPFQAALLAKSNFLSVHKDVKITISAGRVVFIGQSGIVQSAKIEMLKLFSGIANCNLTKKSIGAALLLDKEVMKKRIDAKLSRKKLVATYEVGGDGDVKVYAFSPEELDGAVAVIKAELAERKVEGGPGCQALLLSAEWKQFKSDLIKKHTPASLSEDGSRIIIVSVSEEILQIESKVQEYISKNISETQFIPLAPGIVEVLKNHASRDFNRLEDKIKVYGADVLIIDGTGRFGCEITSVRSRLPEVTAEVHTLARLVICKPYKAKQQSHVNYLYSSIGRSSVEHVALKFHVSIKFPEEMRAGHTQRQSSTRLCDPYPCAEVNLSCGKTIRLVIGDITRHRVDVIVNAANAQLKHGSGVAGAISTVGGTEIDRECDDYMKSRGHDLICGEIFVSTPGRLPCKAVVHTVGPVWHDGKKNEEKDLAKAVTGALSGCPQYRTVALPAISCGIFRFPRDLAVKIIVAETRGFLERSKSAVNRVDLISGDRLLIDEFKKMLCTTFGSSKVTDLHPTSPAANTANGGNYEEIEEIDDDSDNSNSGDNEGDHGDTDNSENENGGEGNTEDNEPSSDYESVANDDDNNDEEEEYSRSSPSDSSQPSATSFKTAEGISVNFVKGSIVTMKADVVFSSVSKNLDLSKGVIAKLIATSAGGGLQTECLTKWPNGIDYGQVVKTSSHGLKTCRSLHFGAVRKWDGRRAGAGEKALRQLVKSSLALAATDGERTIAFPSVGTGYLSFPADCVARSMLDEVVSFSQTSGTGTAITDVYFVIHDRDRATLDAFQKEFNARASGKTTSFNATGERGDGYRSNRGRGQHYHRGHHGRGRRYNHSQEAPPVKPSRSNGGHGRGKQLRCTLGDITFCVKPGNIVAQHCDAIVNSTNEKLDLSVGALSKAIVNAGGSVIQQECNSIGGVKHGMAITAAGSLPSQFVFHLAPKRDIASWKAVIGRCLKEAEHMKLKSLVMPPLGTGRTGVGSVQEMAAVIFTEVSSFAQSKPSYLQSISVVLHEPEMIDDFIAAVERAEKEEGHPVRKFFGKVKDKIDKAVTFMFGSDDSDSDSSKRHQLSQKKKYHKFLPNKSSKTLKENRVPSKLILHIYGMLPGQIDDAINGLEDLCSSARKTHPLNNSMTKDFLEKMTSEQEDKLKSLVRRHEAVINIDRSRSSMILEGDADKIAVIVGDIYHYMLNEKEKSFAERETVLFAKQAVWQYNEGSKFKSFGKHTTALLEKSFQEKKPAADWTNATGQNRVTFKDMKYVTGDRKTHHVRRFEPGKINLPPLWAPMKPTDVYLAVSVNAGSEEYKHVEKNLLATAGGLVKSVIKIERIQNPGLYKQYMTMKLEMDKVNGHQPSNERRLWHGTAGSNTTNISSRNFNRNYGGVHGLAIGNGVYFATGSSYSIQGYSPADASGQKYIYQARVLTGKFTNGQAGLREPPSDFNSVVNSTSSPSMFVVFYDAQTYPEYLITFT